MERLGEIRGRREWGLVGGVARVQGEGKLLSGDGGGDAEGGEIVQLEEDGNGRRRFLEEGEESRERENAGSRGGGGEWQRGRVTVAVEMMREDDRSAEGNGGGTAIPWRWRLRRDGCM